MNIKLKEKLFNEHLLENYYIGTVVDVNDIGYKETGYPLFRVKVSIPGLTDKLSKDLLPWYVVKQTPSDTYNQQGRIPRVGTKVYVEFPYRDIYNGIVSFQLPNTPPELKG